MTSLVWVSGFPYINPVTLLPDKSAFVKSYPLATTLFIGGWEKP
jgi:hypothetical protein